MTLSESVQISGGIMLAFARRKTRVRDLHGLPETLAWAGSLELKLATSRKDIRKAQK